MPFDGAHLDPVTQRLVIGKTRIENGWCKGQLHIQDRNGDRFCMAGALMNMDDVDNRFDPPYIKALLHLDIVLSSSSIVHPSVVRYNDHIASTKEEVLAIYDDAIAISMKKAVING